MIGLNRYDFIDIVLKGTVRLVTFLWLREKYD